MGYIIKANLNNSKNEWSFIKRQPSNFNELEKHEL